MIPSCSSTSSCLCSRGTVWWPWNSCESSSAMWKTATQHVYCFPVFQVPEQHVCNIPPCGSSCLLSTCSDVALWPWMSCKWPSGVWKSEKAVDGTFICRVYSILPEDLWYLYAPPVVPHYALWRSIVCDVASRVRLSQTFWALIKKQKKKNKKTLRLLLYHQ